MYFKTLELLINRDRLLTTLGNFFNLSAVVVAKMEEQLLLTLDPGFESRHQQILERINFLQNCWKDENTFDGLI